MVFFSGQEEGKGKEDFRKVKDEIEDFFLDAQDDIQYDSLDDNSKDFDIDDETGGGNGSKDPDFPVCAYALLNLLLISWGLIGLVMTVGHQTQNMTDRILKVDQGTLNLPPYFVYASNSLGILTGLSGLIFLFLESSIIFPIIPHLNGLIEGFSIMATLCAIGGWAGPNVHKYQRLLEMDTLNRTGEGQGMKYTKRKLGKEYEGFWDKLQNTLQCCGLEGVHNWVKSVCVCIPTSCCQEEKRKECERRINEWGAVGSPHHHNLSHVEPYLWPKNCMEEMTREINNLKRDWVSFPLILIFFHVILMFNLNFIVVAARNRYSVAAGFRVMASFKEKVKKGICCACTCKKNKVTKILKKNKVAAVSKNVDTSKEPKNNNPGTT